MEVSSSAGYASALNLLQTRSQLQVGQVKQSADQVQQVTDTLLAGGTSSAAPSGGRGQLVDIQV